MFKKLGSVNPALLEKKEYQFYIEHINASDIVFDVGANIGELTLLFSRFTAPTGIVHSFEPTKETFQKLSAVVNSSGKENVKLNNSAVYRYTGEIEFNEYNESHSSFNTIANRPLEKYGVNIPSPKQEKLPCVSIDDYCNNNNIKKIDLLKIDVEGAELDVLYGASNMIKQKKVKTIVFEFGQTVFDMGNTVEDYIAFFKEHNYLVKNVYPKQKCYPVNSNKTEAYFAIHYAKPII